MSSISITPTSTVRRLTPSAPTAATSSATANPFSAASPKEMLNKELFNALREGDFNGVKKIIENENIDVNTKEITADECTPLCLASRHGFSHIVEYLINKGAQIDAQNKHLNSPLQMSLIKYQDYNYQGSECPPRKNFLGEHLKNFKLLLKAGARINIKNKRGTHFLDQVQSDFKYDTYCGWSAPIEIDKIFREISTEITLEMAKEPNEIPVNCFPDELQVESNYKFPIIDLIKAYKQPDYTKFLESHRIWQVRTSPSGDFWRKKNVPEPRG